MDRDITDTWADQFDKIKENVTSARSRVESLYERIGANMSPEVSDSLRLLHVELNAIERTNSDLSWYFCKNSLDRWLMGAKLTRDEYYLLAAPGIMKAGEAYETYCHFYYEDDEQRGYINPSEYLDPPAIPAGNGGETFTWHIKMGIVPERVRVSFLKPDQKDFLEKFEPNLFSRFRKD